MRKCEACHRSPKPGERTKWAVDAKFQHLTHRIDVSRTAKVVDTSTVGWGAVDKSTATKLDCTVCHATLDSGKNPAMQACRTCHDGQHAFKDTGFACARCHGPGSGS